ncbi:MAG: GntR family transcriptional regulator [Alphaproteobacteria bacterium]
MPSVATGLSTLASSVTERLRADILSGALAPETKLRIERVCASYSAGASPVREALNRLTAEGLVRQHDQRGFSVAPISLEDLRDLVTTRCRLEAIALTESIARHSASWEEGIVLAFYRLSRTPRSSSPSGYQTHPDWEQHHRAFHEALIADCSSTYLRGYCADLRDQADRYRQIAAATVYPRRHESDEHKAIMDAAIAGRTDEAVLALTAHYQTTLSIIETHADRLFGQD